LDVIDFEHAYLERNQTQLNMFKKTKEEVEYSYPHPIGRLCGFCEFARFRQNALIGECEKVCGEIERDHFCKEYKLREPLVMYSGA
jgi:hypothetical protein